MLWSILERCLIEDARVELFRVSGRVGFCFSGSGRVGFYPKLKDKARVGSGLLSYIRVSGKHAGNEFFNFMKVEIFF